MKKYKCVDNKNGTYFLTIGKVYEVVDEDNPNPDYRVSVKNDDGWENSYPMRCFVEVIDVVCDAAPAPELDDGSTSAGEILKKASEALSNRAVERDHEEGTERSMALVVALFNTYTGHKLSETDGWKFALCLKMGRSANGNFREDDFVDMAAYSALAGESAAKESNS